MVTSTHRDVRIGYCAAVSGYTDRERQRRTSILEALIPPGFSIQLTGPTNGPTFLDGLADFDAAVDATAAWARTLPADEFDVVISAGALDPGLSVLRQILAVPVVGPGEASLFIGALLNRRLSIVTVDKYAVEKATGFIAQTATKPVIASVRSIGVPVREIVADLDRGRSALRGAARTAIEEDGAEAIMLGAMTLGTLDLAGELRETLGVPVIDPVRTSLRAAVQCVEASVVDRRRLGQG